MMSRSLSFPVISSAALCAAACVFQACAEGTNSASPADWIPSLAPSGASATAGTSANVRAAWQTFTETNAALATKAAPNTSVDYQGQLELARRHRTALQFAEATALYTGVVLSAAPEAMRLAALIDMAEMAQEQNDLLRAQQIYAQCLSRWPQASIAPEILLRQGLVYRQMGLHNLAIAKLYAVMTSALTVKSDRFDYYQQLVLRAQNEIAETQYELGHYADAVDSFSRLLKLDPPPGNRSDVQYRYIRCLTALERRGEAIAQAQDFLTRYPDAGNRPEVHFLCATALKQAGRENEALAQVLALLQEQSRGTNCTAQTLVYWQRRAGNAIANQFYQEGDALKALEIYQRLAGVESAPEWQLPVWYQIGLVLERLGQPAKALESYSRIEARGAGEGGAKLSPSLKVVIEMAAWRKEFLAWQVKTETTQMALRAAALGTSAEDPPSSPHP